MQRQWDIAVAEARRETDQFTLGGETFTVRVPLPAVAFVDYARRAMTGAADVMAQVEFLACCLAGEDQASGVERVERAMRVSKIDAGTFDELITELVKEITARPTGPLSDSASSPPASGEPSRDASASPPESGSTPAASVSENS